MVWLILDCEKDLSNIRFELRVIMFDDFVKECDNSVNWPKNLLHSSYIRSLLEEQYKQLSLRNERLFITDGQDAQVELVEVLTGKKRT
jgi:hypothetical protein